MLNVDTGGQSSCIWWLPRAGREAAAIVRVGGFADKLTALFLPSSAVKVWTSKPVLILKGKATWKGFSILQ